MISLSGSKLALAALIVVVAAAIGSIIGLGVSYIDIKAELAKCADSVVKLESKEVLNPKPEVKK